MRARTVLLVVAILLVAGFAALNWDEVTRTAPLSFGAGVTDAPLGLILLGILALLLIAFVVSAAMHRTQTLVESRHHYKTMESQRALAERAEASRFTDLRQYMDAQLRELKQRDAVAATEFEKAMLQAQKDMRAHMDQMHRMMMARFDTFDRRLDGHRVHDAALEEQRLRAPLAEERERARLADERARARLAEERAADPLVEPPPQVRHPL